MLLKALDIGKTLTRFNFPQDEAYNPLGILLARHLTQLDEAQRNATEGTEEENAGDDHPRPEVADAVLAISATTQVGGSLGLQPSADSEQGGESSGSGDGIVVRDSRPANPTPLPSDVSTDNLRITTEITFDITFTNEGTNGAPDDRPPAANGVVDRAEVGMPTLPEGVPEGTIITPIIRSD